MAEKRLINKATQIIIEMNPCRVLQNNIWSIRGNGRDELSPITAHTKENRMISDHYIHSQIMIRS